MYIYLLIGLLWAVGILTYASFVHGYFNYDKAVYKKVIRGVFIIFFQTVFWPILSAVIIYKLIKGEKNIALHYFSFK